MPLPCSLSDPTNTPPNHPPRRLQVDLLAAGEPPSSRDTGGTFQYQQHSGYDGGSQASIGGQVVNDYPSELFDMHGNPRTSTGVWVQGGRDFLKMVSVLVFVTCDLIYPGLLASVRSWTACSYVMDHETLQQASLEGVQG